MWHEARRQERKIRGMMVDYRRRAERRRDFYEKIKADPTQFLQLHGRQCKIHLDPAVAAAADSPAAMMPWQGQADNLIDRFDVRAHLDYMPPVKKQEEEEITYEERQINYERYRIIAQNVFLGISEEKFLKQLHMEEQFGYTEPESKKKKTGGAAIGFNYDDGTSYQAQLSTANSEENSDENSDSDLDVDLYINVSKVDQYQAHEMNKHGLNFGMSSNDFYSFLTDDMEEAESNRLAREEEHEKALFSGRKSRRERRAHREKRLANRVISPPSYAARSSPTYPSFRESKSPSRSPTPVNTGKITYITSFGGDDEQPSTSKTTYADKVRYGKKNTKYDSPNTTVSSDRRKRSTSAERNRNYRRKRRSRSTQSRSPRSKRSSRSRKQSRSRDRYRRRSRTRSRDRTRKYRSRRSRSSSYSSKSRSISKMRNRSRSRSRISTRSSSSSSTSSSSSATSRSHSVANKFNKSKSPSIKKESPPKVTIQRYYGRKRSDQSSSSELEDLSDGENTNNVKPVVSPALGENKVSSYGNAVSAFKKNTAIITVTTATTTSTVTAIATSGNSAMSLQERLRRKRQALLSKQFKADKLAEQLKSEREKQEQQNREDELREMAIKLRRRQREIRHAYDSHSSGSSSESEDRKSGNSSTNKNQKSRSGSPKEKRDEREHKSRESRNRDRERERSRERRDRSSKNSPKPRESEKRPIYYTLNKDKEDGNIDRDRSDRDSKKRDDYKREFRNDYRREYRETRKDDYNKERTSRSLVDY